MKNRLFNIIDKRFGFTLAEVLITLGIIGIVASMTIPIIMNNIQNQQFKSQMRKTYSILSEAHQLLKTENSGSFAYSISTCSGDGDNSCFKDALKTKLHFIKECETNNGLGNCFPALANVKYLNGTSANGIFILSQVAGLVLNDGSSIVMRLESPTCTNSGSTPAYPNRCGYILADVNGMKPPNTWGRDIYLFFVYSDVIRPAAVGNVESGIVAADDCGTGDNTGYTCASKYLLGN